MIIYQPTSQTKGNVYTQMKDLFHLPPMPPSSTENQSPETQAFPPEAMAELGFKDNVVLIDSWRGKRRY